MWMCELWLCSYWTICVVTYRILDSRRHRSKREQNRMREHSAAMAGVCYKWFERLEGVLCVWVIDGVRYEIERLQFLVCNMWFRVWWIIWALLIGIQILPHRHDKFYGIFGRWKAKITNHTFNGYLVSLRKTLFEE